MFILGVSALYHDSAACLIEDGKIVAAAQEERFTRKKHDSRIPEQAMKYCLDQAKITIDDIDAVVYYDDPILTLDRFLANVKAIGTDNNDILKLSYESMFKEKLWIANGVERILGGLGKRGKLLVTSHHLSHAASAFYPSPFEEAMIITIDGVGEWNTTVIGHGKGNKISLKKKIDYPHSLGLLYSAFTYFCGFKVNYGDYKLMGLAPYGEPIYYDLICEKLIDIKDDGSFRLNLSYFDFQYGRAMTNDKFALLFEGERRLPESEITIREMNMAASVQKVVENILLKLARTAKSMSDGCENLVLAGGVALNCVANGLLLKEGIFKNIWIQPASGDAGGSLGAAMMVYYGDYGMERVVECTDSQQGSYLGPEFSDEMAIDYFKGVNAVYHRYSLDNNFYSLIAELLEKEKVIGLFEGRMEFGPRALGNRSIIADPRSDTMQSKLNRSIKYRESFRPFAPAVLIDRCRDYFELDVESPYMLLCGQVKGREDLDFSIKEQLGVDSNLIPIVNRRRSCIPAVTHVDYSARVQTVSKERNEIFYDLIKAFEERTGCGCLINTSFNVRGEPIVCSVEDAYKCFMNTEMDVLVVNDLVLYKEEQPLNNKRRETYDPD